MADSSHFTDVLFGLSVCLSSSVRGMRRLAELNVLRSNGTKCLCEVNAHGLPQ